MITSASPTTTDWHRRQRDLVAASLIAVPVAKRPTHGRWAARSTAGFCGAPTLRAPTVTLPGAACRGDRRLTPSAADHATVPGDAYDYVEPIAELAATASWTVDLASGFIVGL